MDLKTMSIGDLLEQYVEAEGWANEAEEDADQFAARAKQSEIEAELTRRFSSLQLRLAAERAEVDVSRAHIDEMTITFDGLKRSLPPDNGMFSIACSMHDQRRDQVDAARAHNDASRKGGE